MLVKISSIEDENKVLAVLPVGHHVLGRGENLNCSDKRVSRSHISLNVDRDGVTLTSIHINPCFYKSTSSKNVSILKRDLSLKLSDGDKFGFLPDQYWFKLQILPDEQAVARNSQEGNSQANESSSTIGDEPQEGKSSQEKKQAEVPASNQTEEKQTSDASAGPSNEDVRKRKSSLGTDESDNKKQKTDETDTTLDESQSDQNNEEQKDETNENVPGTSGNGNAKKKTKRDRCWYGVGCYRKNPNHRNDLSHPGDSDYGSDPDDNRPDCQFGAACYRRNKLHRRDYKHPAGPPPKKMRKQRAAAAAAKKKANTNTNYSNDESDEYDYDDPFLDDGDSDEYVEDSVEEDDTDWEPDSQDLDEDSEDIKRLRKEAKRFTKK